MPEKWELERLEKVQEFLDVDKPTDNIELIPNPSAEELMANDFGSMSESDVVLSPIDVKILLEGGVLKIDVFREYNVWLRVCKG